MYSLSTQLTVYSLSTQALIPPDEYEQRVEAAAECFDKMSAMSSEELPVFYLGSGEQRILTAQ